MHTSDSLTQQHDNIPFSISEHQLSFSLGNWENLEGKYGVFTPLKIPVRHTFGYLSDTEFLAQWLLQASPKRVGKGFPPSKVK